MTYGFDEQMRLVDIEAQIEALQMGKRLINGLPDGYPMPLVDRK